MGACPKNNGHLVGPRSDFLNWTERDEIRKSVFARDVPFCVWCGEELGDHRSKLYYTVDHVETRAEGGPYAPDNLVLSCKPCNLERGSLSILQYMVHRATKRSAEN